MTQYLVMWQHWHGQSAAELVKKDFASGVLKDWGMFGTTGRGYAIVNAKDEVELSKHVGKYREFEVQFLSAEPILSFEQVLKMMSE
jgi:hypothetical protein